MRNRRPFAAETNVQVGRTIDEIKSFIQQRGGTRVRHMEDDDGGAIAFMKGERWYLFRVPYGDPTDEQFTLTPSGQWRRTEADARAHWEQDKRSRWRALDALIRFMWEGADRGLADFERLFLPYLLVTETATLGDILEPQVREAQAAGNLPSAPLLALPVATGRW